MHVSAVTGEGSIFEAVQSGDRDKVSLLIQHDRRILKQRGWGGFTALHFAALCGNLAIAELLLNCGADPNIICDAGQTPFHFACRHGNISIMHKMMQHGADLRVVDRQGKTSLHHAVSGGSIVAMQYLWETSMFQFSDADNLLITPLHIAAFTGNTDVVRYLLRENRCTVDAVDQQGATALHVAAEKGALEVCWLLLQNAGFHILHMKNHAGLTPLDLCSRGTTLRHQQVTKMLTQFISKPKDQKPRESYMMYYWTLLIPSVTGVAVLLIAAALGEHGGIFCGLLFPLLAKVTLTQYHRMHGYQRLPNPIYLGTLAAGVIHTLICFYCKILPNIWPAYYLLHVSLLHFSLVLGLFWKVVNQDPGRLQAADADPRFSTIADLVVANQNPSRFCIYCENQVARLTCFVSDHNVIHLQQHRLFKVVALFKPAMPIVEDGPSNDILFQVDDCKHCRLCDFCVLDYDHHCIYLNRCVGRNNHRIFVLFILATLAAQLIFISSAGYYLCCGARMEENWSLIAAKEFWVLLLILLNTLAFLWEAWLLFEQFDAISSGTTIYYRKCRHKSSWRKRLAIALSFLIEGTSFRARQNITDI